MAEVRWIRFPDARLAVNGLYWFAPESPQLRRLPARAERRVTPAVWDLAQFPVGGRIRFCSDTGELRLRYTGARPRGSRLQSGLDVYADGRYWSSVVTQAQDETEQTFFAGAEAREREISICLPLLQTVQVHAIGIERAARIGPPSAFSRPQPLVLYGSSIAQGVGAARAGMPYQAILARRLGLDFVNLGFGGAGKAEPEMVQLLAEVDACCFLFDLGKSYGRQDAGPYEAMLTTIRQAHPATPLVCITPIFSTREHYDPAYVELSAHTRSVVAQAVAGRRAAGDADIHLVDGLELLGAADSDEFHEGVHPSDLGHWRIATRLEPTLGGLIS